MSTTASVKERPILFSGPMVKAILGDRKTQTRRVFKPSKASKMNLLPDDFWQIDPDEPGTAYLDDFSGRLEVECPYGKPGERLWVRESLERHEGVAWYYSADGHEVRVDRSDETAMVTWCHHKMVERCPSIFMPRWASRLTLEITDVRVERLHAISEADKIAEGGTPDKPFGTVWRAINTKPGIRWEDNPWVWVVSFRRIETASATT